MEKLEEEHPITAILDAVDLSSSTWYYHQNKKQTYEEKYAKVIENIHEILDNHPGYGYPKIKRELDRSYEETAGFEVVRKLLNLKELKMKRTARKGPDSGYRKAISDAEGSLNLLKRKESIEPFEVVCTDFTEIKYDQGRLRAKLIPIVGYRCKMIFGWAVGKQADSDLALLALDEAMKQFEELGINPEGMILHQDQDAVFTGNRWADRLLNEEGMRLSYSEDGAKENTMMESTIGHFKCDAKNLFQEAGSMCELESRIEDHVGYWNRERMHSSLDYRTPQKFVEISL